MKRDKVYFIVLTSYQLFVSDAYAQFLHKRYQNLIIKIFSVGVNLPIHTDAYDFIFIPDLNKNKIDRLKQRLIWGGRFFFTTPIFKYFNKISDCELFVFNDNEPITNKIIRTVFKGKNNSITIIEEGIGIYELNYISENTLSFAQKVRYFGTWLMGSPMQYKAVGESDMISNVVVSDVEIYKSLRKAVGKNIFQQNKKYIYNNAENFLRKIGCSTEKYKDFSVLYLGQPFTEFGDMSPEEEKLLSKIFSSIGNVLIKPHPRDKYGKYESLKQVYGKLNIVSNDVAVLPLECLINALEVNIVLSLNSSAGVNLAKNYPYIKCIYMYELDEAQECISLWDNGYAEMNKELFFSEYNNIYTPKTIEELKYLIESFLKEDDMIELTKDDKEPFELVQIMECLNDNSKEKE